MEIVICIRSYRTVMRSPLSVASGKMLFETNTKRHIESVGLLGIESTSGARKSCRLVRTAQAVEALLAACRGR